jgi:hypothetical protein
MNLTRLTNLFRSSFIENKKTLLICSIISFSVLAFGFTISAMPEIAPLTPYALMFFLSGMFFQPSLKKNNSTYFFNLPVSTIEKFIHAIVVIIIIGVIIHLLAIAGAFTGYYVFHPLLHNDIDINRWVANGKMDIINQLMFDRTNLYIYAVLISVFLFGSVYFKSKAFIKTIAVGTIVSSSFSFYIFILMTIVFRNLFIDLRETKIDFEFNIMGSSFWQNYSHVIPIALILFFLSLTYLRLRETEV